eukprot:9645263-Prorocentrum_lima.AAC.1
MTSSLVGSEMCIRDRESTAAASANVSSTQGNNDGKTLRSNYAIAQENSCLLYTSDAADDM